jgi:ribosomal protein S18 acetylase RimI-like enzyme
VKLSKPQPRSLEGEEFEALKVGLNGYNESFTGLLLRGDVSCVLKDISGNTLGAALGEINWGWLYIKALWIDEKARSKGWGTKILQEMENYASSEGIKNVRLETTSFQALGFYEKLGYVIFGELEDMPPGERSYFLRKGL